MAGGKQYIAVLVGYGGSTAVWGEKANVGWKWGEPRYLLVYALGGTAPPPPMPAKDMALHPVDDPKLQLNAADVATGAGLFLYCTACHGVNLVSPEAPAPDLRQSSLALNADAFYKVVHDGMLLPAGMPEFTDLTRAQVNDLYQYIRAGARAALPAQRAPATNAAPAQH
jgi:quinohemoprotein ethanol dehydrogenase